MDADGNAPHLLAAATHQQGLVLAQVDVHHKTNEIPMFAPLLDTLNITGMLITADCLHTQREHARYLHQRDADFVFCVKDNQPGLFAALDALPWRDVPITHTTTTGDTAGSKPAPCCCASAILSMVASLVVGLVWV